MRFKSTKSVHNAFVTFRNADTSDTPSLRLSPLLPIPNGNCPNLRVETFGVEICSCQACSKLRRFGATGLMIWWENHQQKVSIFPKRCTSKILNKSNCSQATTLQHFFCDLGKRHVFCKGIYSSSLQISMRAFKIGLLTMFFPFSHLDEKTLLFIVLLHSHHILHIFNAISRFRQAHAAA